MLTHCNCVLQDIGAPAFSAPTSSVQGGQPLANGQAAPPPKTVAKADSDGALQNWKSFVSTMPSESASARVERINSISRFFRT